MGVDGDSVCEKHVPLTSVDALPMFSAALPELPMRKRRVSAVPAVTDPNAYELPIPTEALTGLNTPMSGTGRAVAVALTVKRYGFSSGSSLGMITSAVYVPAAAHWNWMLKNDEPPGGTVLTGVSVCVKQLPQTRWAGSPMSIEPLPVLSMRKRRTSPAPTGTLPNA